MRSALWKTHRLPAAPQAATLSTQSSESRIGVISVGLTQERARARKRSHRGDGVAVHGTIGPVGQVAGAPY